MKSGVVAFLAGAAVVVSLSACSGAGSSGSGSSNQPDSFNATIQLKANLGPNVSASDFPDGGDCYGGDLAENHDLRQKQLQVLNSKNEIVGASAIGTGTVHQGSDPWCGFTVTVADVTADSKLYTVKIDDMVSDAFTVDQLKQGDASFEVYQR